MSPGALGCSRHGVAGDGAAAVARRSETHRGLAVAHHRCHYRGYSGRTDQTHHGGLVTVKNFFVCYIVDTELFDSVVKIRLRKLPEC